MEKFIIMVNYGYGEEYEEVDAENKEAAMTIAASICRERAENSMDYSASKWTKELADDCL